MKSRLKSIVRKHKWGEVFNHVFLAFLLPFYADTYIPSILLKKKLPILPSEYKNLHNVLQLRLSLIGELVRNEQTLPLNETKT